MQKKNKSSNVFFALLIIRTIDEYIVSLVFKYVL